MNFKIWEWKFGGLTKKQQKQLVLRLFIILAFAGVLIYLISPIAINLYLSQQPILTAYDTRFDLYNYSKVIVLEGKINNQSKESFTITERNGDVIGAKTTNRINCIPKDDTIRRIAGAWNTKDGQIYSPIGVINKKINDSGKFLYIANGVYFYTVWVIDGC